MIVNSLLIDFDFISDEFRRIVEAVLIVLAGITPVKPYAPSLPTQYYKKIEERAKGFPKTCM
jgi:hypothetical protein